MESLIAASIAFVGSHFLLSHPLRKPLVGALGLKGFFPVYAIVALATFAWMALAYRAAPAEAPWWPASDTLWAAGTLAMLVSAILFVGSLFGNPAMPDPQGRGITPPDPRGVFTVTRHPMMWGFALWGVTHFAVFPTAAHLVLASAIVVLALVGSALQDAKKAAIVPGWTEWQARTSYWPFAAILSGKTRFRLDARAALGGLVLWLAATWAHIPLASIPAGIWRWVGG
jgi:uncharacterized membrane protein